MCTLLTLLDFFIRFQCTERNTAFLHFFSIYTIGREKEKLRKDLIKNFFYRNQEEYELILIDSSIYSSNEKIVATLENEIITLLKKYNIFIKNKNIEEEIFIQSNNFISTIYNFFFRKTTVED